MLRSRGMIDRRVLKVYDHEIDDGLNEISDTAILLNFNSAIYSLYPHLIPIYAHAYDAWDDIVIPLFYEMVYKTFAFKYGVNITPKETHSYMYTLKCYKGIHHIECIPKELTIKALVNGEWVNIDTGYLKDKMLIYKSFGDGLHFLTGGIDASQASKVHFDLVEVDIVYSETGYCSKGTVFIHKDDLDYSFVAETYNENKHK
ncbi:MAG: hypothetical protein ACQEXQ_29185 [Bacillota bacterium]